MGSRSLKEYQRESLDALGRFCAAVGGVRLKALWAEWEDIGGQLEQAG